MDEDFRDDAWINDLPMPLVRWCHSALHGGEDHLRHSKSLNLFENIVKLMVTPCLAAYLSDLTNGSSGDRAVETQLQEALPTPSFGSWVSLLKALAKYCASRTDYPLGEIEAALNRDRREADAPATIALYCRIKNGPHGPPANKTKCKLRNLLEDLVGYRNAVIGHPDQSKYESLYIEVLPLLSDAIREILGDSGLPVLGKRGSRLVYIDRIEKQDDQYEIQLLELKGLLPRRSTRVFSREQADRLNPQRVAVLWPDCPLPFLLDPFLIYRDEDNQVLYFDSKGFQSADTKAGERWMATLRRLLPADAGQRQTAMGAVGQDDLPIERVHAAPCVSSAPDSLLPYLIDRTEQEFYVEDILDHNMVQRNSGLKVFIVSGTKEQCHREFCERLCKVTLPELNHEPVDHPSLDCPFDSKRKDRTQFKRFVSRELKKRVRPTRSGPSGIEVIQAGDQPRVVYTYLLSTDWSSLVQNQVDWFLRFWEEIELNASSKPQLVCLGIQYLPGAGWWGRRTQRKKNAALMSWLEQLAPEDYPGLTLAKLPELSNVTLPHVVDWVNRYFRSDRRMRALEEEFQPMPMQQFVEEYERIVTRRSERADDDVREYRKAA